MSALTANIVGSGIAIPSPGPGKSIGILSISANAPCELRENEATGNLISYIPQGSTDLTSCINAGMDSNGEGNACYVSSATVCTLTYALMDKFGGNIFGCPFTWPAVPAPVPGFPGNAGLGDALCGSADCTALSYGSNWNNWWSSREAVIEFVEDIYGGDTNFKGRCGDCENFAPGEYCYIPWCYNNGARGPWGWQPVRAGWTFCYGPTSSSSTSAAPSSSSSNSSASTSSSSNSSASTSSASSASSAP